MAATNHTPWFKRLHRAVRHLIWVLLVLVICGLGLGRLALEYGDGLIHKYLVDQLAKQYAPLAISIRSVERLPGVGLEVRGLSVVDTYSSPPQRLLYIDEMLVRCNTRWESLLQKDIDVRQINIRRPKLRAQRRDDGTWNTTALLKLPKFGEQLASIPALVVEDGEVELIQGALSSSPITIHRVQATVREARRTDGTPLLKYEGSCASQLFDRATLAGYVSLNAKKDQRRSGAREAAATAEWKVAGELTNLRLNPELPACLPVDLAEQMQPLSSLRGWANLTYSFESRRDLPLEYVIRGKLLEGSVSDESLPYSLTNLNAEFAVDRTGLSIQNASVRAGPSELKLELVRSGKAGQGPLMLLARTDQFPLDKNLPQILPPNLRELWARFTPSGVADIRLQLPLDGRPLRPDLLIDCRELSFTYDRFPYRVHDGFGTLHLHHGQLDIDLKTPISGKTTSLSGQLNVLQQPISGWVEIDTDGAIPLDEAILRALPKEQQQLIRSLHPTGMIQFFGHFERQPGQEIIHRDMEVHLHGCSMRYDNFPYPIDRIHGKLVVNDSNWSFDDLTGHISSGYISADGSWNPQATDHQLRLDFQCTDVPLDDTLKNALREDVRNLWSKLQPRGTMDFLNVTVRFNRGSPVDVEVDAEKLSAEHNVEGRTITVRPVWFPYRLDNVAGKFHYRNGKATITDVEGEHGTARLKKVAGSCERFADGTWELTLNPIDVEQLLLDADLLAALPARLSRSLRRLQLVGALNLNGWLQFRGRRPDGIDEVEWDLTTDMEDATLDCASRLEHLRGSVRWTGSHRDQQLVARGEVRMDSLMFRGIHVTHVRGPLRIDEREVALGASAQAAPATNGLPRTISGRVFGGEMTLDATLSLNEDQRFELLFNLTDADLARITRETGAATANISGKTFAALKLRGQTGQRESWRGEGTVQLFDADIYQLPLMVALLKLLNIRPLDDTAFTNADARYLIEGDRVRFERIGLQGDAISLIGSGYMNAQRQLNLDFYAVVGREEWQLPVFRSLFKEAAQNVLSIKVTGTLNDPVIDPQPFPGLDQTIESIFQEAPLEQPFPPLPNLLPREAEQPRRGRPR